MKRILYVSADLRRVGPTNQTLNIIYNANDDINMVHVLTLFDEPSESMIQDYWDKGISVESLNLRRGNFFFIFKALYGYLKRASFSLVHSNGVKPDICLYLVSKILKFKHVITLRNIPMEDAPTRMNWLVGVLIGIVHTYVIRHTEYVVACSKTVSEVMAKKYNCKKIKAIQNGVDVNKFVALDKQKCRKKLGIGIGPIVFISTGSFIHRKHNDLVIDAFLKSDVPNSILLMLGDGPLLETIKNKYSNFKNVFFKGLVSDVQEYLSASDVFLSASESEGLPNAVLEAIACNLPVILSDIPQHREILDELPGCGMDFSLNDRSCMSNKISKIALCLREYSNPSIYLLHSSLTMQRMGLLYKELYKFVMGPTHD